MSKLPREFYEQETLIVAEKLIGCYLHRIVNGQELIGRITETEAYCGPQDDACHSSKGRTARTEVIFGPPGHVYVYLIYGIWSCFNVVCRPENTAEAVLIRAVEPVAGIDFMIQQRGKSKNIADGPGKLCQAFAIARQLNSADLLGEEIFITERKPTDPLPQIQRTPRIGIDYAEKCRDELWRFVRT